MGQTKDLRQEILFTQTYRKHQHEHFARREAACLRAQFPAILGNIQDHDLFAGRLEFGAVGFSTQEQIGGTGYFCRENALLDELQKKSIDLPYREDVHEMLMFWRKENTTQRVVDVFPPALRGTLPTIDWENQPAVVFPIIRCAGSFIDYEKLLRLGIGGLRAEVAQRREGAPAGSEAGIFFEAALDALALFGECCDYYSAQARRLAVQAVPARVAELERIAESLDLIRTGRPLHFRDAIQLSWLYSVLCSALEYGRMDTYLGDFLAADLDAGVLAEGEALRMVQSLWGLIRSMDVVVDGRVIIGGRGRRNEANADRFALLAIEASRTIVDVLPQLTLRFYKGMNPKLMEAAYRSIGEGRTFPLLYNDDVNVPAVQSAFGVGGDVAEQYVPLGCGEYVLDHMSFDTPSNNINLLKALEITLRNGVDPVSGRQMGPRTGRFEDFSSFDQLFEAWKRQMRHFIEAAAEQQVLQYKVIGEDMAFLLISALYDDCLSKGAPLFAGGVRYLQGCLECYGNTNTADSLTAIKQLVYEKKLITPARLLEMLDGNFHGFESEQRALLACPKYGNDDDEADAMLVRVHDFTCEAIREQGPRVGLHSFLAVIINNAQNTTLASWVGASADGRKAGMAMANANNPTSGADEHGITAMINSILKPSPRAHAGSVQNLRFSKEAYRGDNAKVMAMLGTYFDRGGSQAMITVIGRGDLEKALREPQKYKDVFVRVGGFSARFVELPSNVQQEILKRTTY
jgi:pyruvate-formate lyase